MTTTILVQNDLFSLIKAQIESNSFAHSSLFNGPRYSGRMSIALEVVRLLSCSGNKESNCNCPYCVAFEDFKVDNLLVVGNRNHKTRIDALLENYKLQATQRAKRELFKAIRIMLLNYRNPLFDSTNPKSSSIFAACGALDESLGFLEEQEDVKVVVSQLEKHLAQINSLIKTFAPLTINQVRLIQRWVTQTSFKNQNRFVIIEGVEESRDSALNSLLKLFEEPPKNTYIITISEFSSCLAATLLSRLRTYQFKQLSEKEKNKLLSEKFFVEGSFYNSIEEFFLDKAKVPYRQIKENANIFIESIILKKSLSRESLEQISLNLDQQQQLEYFFKESENSLGNFYYNNEIPVSQIKSISSTLKESLKNALTFNQNERLLIESIYYRLMD
jgi:DNA polymerase III delta prime subunit